MTAWRQETLRAPASAGVLRGETLDPRYARFAREVAGLDALAPVIGAALVEQLRPGEKINQINFAPCQKVLRDGHRNLWEWVAASLTWETTPDWVIVATDRQVLVASLTEAGLTVTAAPITDILTLEQGHVLLHAWVEWYWVSRGELARMRIVFNVVGRRLFHRLMETVRLSLMMPAPAPTALAADKFAGVPFKFRNFITYELCLPQEQLQAVVYQPEFAYGPRRWLGRSKAPATAFVVTDGYVMLVQQDMPDSLTRWGLDTRFSPLGRVRRAQLETDAEVVWLSLQFEAGGVSHAWRAPFERQAESTLREALTRLPG